VLVLCAGCLAIPRQASTLTTSEAEKVDTIALIAESLDKGDTDSAIKHLEFHVSENPDQPFMRAMLCEQLFKMGRYAESRDEYLRTLESYDTEFETRRDEIIQCHTKLVVIAQMLDDELLEKRHRSIGLILVAEHQSHQQLTEQTLSQAVSQLRDVCENDRLDAEAHFYLGQALAKLGQHSAARSVFKAVKSTAPGHLPLSLKKKLRDE
jgi:Tfp pilus assembly protein PilF